MANLIRCYSCSGTGFRPTGLPGVVQTCPICHGSRYVEPAAKAKHALYEVPGVDTWQCRDCHSPVDAECDIDAKIARLKKELEVLDRRKAEKVWET